MNSLNKELTDFVNILDQYDWFCDAELDDSGRFIVYVDKMDFEFIKNTPDKIDGHQILFHFAASQPSQSITFKHKTLVSCSTNNLKQFVLEDEEYFDLDYLVKELARLQNICGSVILEGIFFEEHDGENAITNVSSRFPSVREDMHLLYNKYGFDLIYDNYLQKVFT